METFYPLYDNGRSLFYEDTEEMVRQAVTDPVKYATSFGYSGTYWDYVTEVVQEGIEIKSLIHLDISKDEVSDILFKSGFTGYRFDGALEWILKTVELQRLRARIVVL